jgi:hypothetical protein
MELVTYCTIGGRAATAWFVVTHPSAAPLSGQMLGLSPIAKLKNGVRRHLQTIDKRVFPPIDGLSVLEIPVAGGT